MFQSKKTQVVLLAIVLIVALTGILLAAQYNRPTATGTNAGQSPGSPEPAETTVEVTLYFSDAEAMYLMPERRNVISKGESIGETVVRELIKGPSSSELKRTIPPETSLLSLSVENGVARVNLSREVQNSHYGGSAGESMLIYSIVNSLAETTGINQVQFLVEGNKVESFYGHIGITEPLQPNTSLIKGRN